MASVNAIPGGYPVPELQQAHQPAADFNPGLFVVGDYLFDSTLNGVIDSADYATDMILGQTLRIELGKPDLVKNHDLAGRADGEGPFFHFGYIDREYFERYRGRGQYAEAYREFFDSRLVHDWSELVWNLQGGFSILDAGSANGLTVRDFRDLGLISEGIENNRFIHARTPVEVRPFNYFGSVLDLPFPDDSFDIVYETCLCHIAESRVGDALDELFRVARRGGIFGSVTSDISVEVLRSFDLLRGVKTLGTWWEWSERFVERGFEPAKINPVRREKLWKLTLDAGKGPDRWFPDGESPAFCFFTKGGHGHVPQICTGGSRGRG